MGLSVEEIIQALQQGKSFDDLSKLVDLTSLSDEALKTLLEQAEKWRNERCGYQLIRLLYEGTPESNYRYRLQLIATLLLRPNAPKKNENLKIYEDILDKWRGTFKRTNPAKQQVEQFQKANVDYQFLRGKLEEDKGNHKKALHHYQNAEIEYRKSGYIKYAENVAEKIKTIEFRKDTNSGALSVDQLLDQQTQLLASNSKLKREIDAAERQLAITQTEINQHNIKLKDLQQEVSNIDSQKQDCQKHLDQLTHKVEALEAGFQFLICLPQAAMAPLWVEVVRLALDKRQIDQFTIEALKRLAIECPEQALPLLAEISARSPEPFTVDISTIKDGMDSWFMLIAEARDLYGKDDMAAAQKMVAGWEMFFAASKDSVSIRKKHALPNVVNRFVPGNP